MLVMLLSVHKTQEIIAVYNLKLYGEFSEALLLNEKNKITNIETVLSMLLPPLLDKVGRC